MISVLSMAGKFREWVNDHAIHIMAGAVLTFGVGSIGGLVYLTYIQDRIVKEVSDVVEKIEGRVLSKAKERGRPLNPMKPLGLRFSNKYNVTVQYEHGTATIDDKGLFEKVEEGSAVRVHFSEQITTTTTYKGEPLEKRLEYVVKTVEPMPQTSDSSR